jgi:hypothetical protein
VRAAACDLGRQILQRADETELLAARRCSVVVGRRRSSSVGLVVRERSSRPLFLLARATFGGRGSPRRSLLPRPLAHSFSSPPRNNTRLAGRRVDGPMARRPLVARRTAQVEVGERGRAVGADEHVLGLAVVAVLTVRLPLIHSNQLIGS